MSIQIENNSEKEDSNFSTLKTDNNNNNKNNINNNNKNNNNNLFEKNTKNELELIKNEIKMDRRKSLNLHDINQLLNLRNYYNINKGMKNDNKNLNNDYNRCKTNKLGINNIQNMSSFRRELSTSNIMANNNNFNKRKSFCHFRDNLNAILNNNYNNNNFNNKSMYINMNMSMNNNNISLQNNNKTMYININNISMNKLISNSEKIKEYENKFRLMSRKRELYDSFEDEEVIEELEEEYIFISPETHRIFIFDTLILFCILFCSFYYPIYIAESICFCSYIPIGIKAILFVTDFLNIFDIIISFFRAYYNFEFILVKKNERIVKHYLQRYFFLDLIVALPIFTLSSYSCKISNPDGNLCFAHGMDFKHNCLKACLGLKLIKIFKVLDKKSNRGINYFHEKISENYTLEKTMKMMLFCLLCIIGFNLFICYHIYIGRQTYPNWILATNNQDKDFKNLYLISFYFLITTITSVGYGDITCVSLGETVFQIIL